MLDFDSKIEIANCSKLWRILNTSLDNVLLQCVAEERSEKKGTWLRLFRHNASFVVSCCFDALLSVCDRKLS